MSDSTKGPLDGFYVEKNKILIFVLCFIPCVSFVMLILNLVCFFTTKSSESKNIAKIGLIIAACLIAVGILFNLLGGMALFLGRR